MKVKNNQPRLVCLGGHVNLGPGVNEVADHLWLKAAHEPSVVMKHMLKTKQLEVLEHPKPEAVKAHVDSKGTARPSEPDLKSVGSGALGEAKTGGTTGLSELTAKEAEDLVSETLDRDTLEAWAKAEQRKPVSEAITAQLQLIKTGPSKKK